MKKDGKYVLPVFCEWCGVLLMGGATVHMPDCEIRKLIEEHFPGYGNEQRTSD
jgi:hypothetical protein